MAIVLLLFILVSVLAELRRREIAATATPALLDLPPEIYLLFLSILKEFLVSDLFFQRTLLLILFLLLSLGRSSITHPRPLSRRRRRIQRSPSESSTSRRTSLTESDLPVPSHSQSAPALVPSHSQSRSPSAPVPSQSRSQSPSPSAPVPSQSRSQSPSSSEADPDRYSFTIMVPLVNDAVRWNSEFGRPRAENLKELFLGLVAGQAVRYVNSSRYAYTVTIPDYHALVLVHRYGIRRAAGFENDQFFQYLSASFYAIGKQLMLMVPSNFLAIMLEEKTRLENKASDVAVKNKGRDAAAELKGSDVAVKNKASVVAAKNKASDVAAKPKASDVSVKNKVDARQKKAVKEEKRAPRRSPRFALPEPVDEARPRRSPRFAQDDNKAAEKYAKPKRSPRLAPKGASSSKFHQLVTRCYALFAAEVVHPSSSMSPRRLLFTVNFLFSFDGFELI